MRSQRNSVIATCLIFDAGRSPRGAAAGGDAAFGPDEIATMVAAYELGLMQINASGHNDPAAETLEQTIVMLTKRGERDPVRLNQRAIEIMSDHDRSP